jgi:glycerol-3-phosphate O-acyltransferase/dihydroxyacetone phosphate acyltransferase
MADPDTHRTTLGPALRRVRGAEVRRGWNGCLEVGFEPWVVRCLADLSFRSLRPLIVALVPGQQKLLNKVKRMRVELQNELADVINELGPQYYDDFEDVRSTFALASASWLIQRVVAHPRARVQVSTIIGAEPSRSAFASEALGTERRARSAQSPDGLLLCIHDLLLHANRLQTWIDERLFGWSKSSKRGTSAWAAQPRSTDGSQLPTPETSDDEDGGDYDNVLGYLSDGYTSPTTRSRAGSYADLQKLRLSRQAPAQRLDIPQYVREPATTTSPTTSPTGSVRSKHARRGSLVDDIPVERISQCDKRQSFDEMTEDLNKETGK